MYYADICQRFVFYLSQQPTTFPSPTTSSKDARLQGESKVSMDCLPEKSAPLQYISGAWLMGFAIYDVPQGLRRLRASLVAAVKALPALLVAPTDESQIMKVDQRVLFKVLCAGVLLIWVPLREVFNSICSLFFKKPKRDMEKEIVLVTGAGRGLGRGMAIEFARLGATVVCWDINESGNKETAELAGKYSRRKGAVRAYRCDVSNREEVLSVAEKVKEEVGNVTLLVNNAGIITAGRLETYKPEDIQRVVNVNFVSHFWTIEAFLPDMKTKNYGQIVCMSSMAALQPSEYMIPYSATKYAVTGLMDTLEEELLSSEYDNIQVTTVHPYFANSNNAMNQIDKQGDGPGMMKAEVVVQTIVDGVLQRKRSFSVPTPLLPLVNIGRLLPRQSVRIIKGIGVGKMSQFFRKSSVPVIVK